MFKYGNKNHGLELIFTKHMSNKGSTAELYIKSS